MDLSIHRAILLLRAVADSGNRGLRLFQLAKIAGLSTTTVHRILSVLSSEGFIEFDPVSKCYHVGIELYVLGNQARQFALREKYRSCLENIARKTNDSVYLVIRSGGDALCIDSIEGKSNIRIMTYNVGSRRPLGIGAGSLALLAFSGDDKIDKILTANKRRYIKNNVSVLRIKALIKKAKETGYAFSEGNYMKGINGVGIPLHDDKGNVIAAISVASIAERIDFPRSQKIAKLVRMEASLIL